MHMFHTCVSCLFMPQFPVLTLLLKEKKFEALGDRVRKSLLHRFSSTRSPNI